MLVHLPSALTVKSVYERMLQDIALISKEGAISQPQFYNLWKEFYSHVSIPAVSASNLNLIIVLYYKENRFAKCDTCCLLKDEKAKTMNSESRKMIQALLDQHLDLQRYIIHSLMPSFLLSPTRKGLENLNKTNIILNH